MNFDYCVLLEFKGLDVAPGMSSSVFTMFIILSKIFTTCLAQSLWVYYNYKKSLSIQLHDYTTLVGQRYMLQIVKSFYEFGC